MDFHEKLLNMTFSEWIKIFENFQVENSKSESKIEIFKTVQSGLMLIAFGNGIKSCISPLGGDQFEPSDQVRFLIR